MFGQMLTWHFTPASTSLPLSTPYTPVIHGSDCTIVSMDHCAGHCKGYLVVVVKIP